MPEQRPGGFFIPLADPLDAGGHVEIRLRHVAHRRNHAIMTYDRLERDGYIEKLPTILLSCCRAFLPIPHATLSVASP